MSRRVLVLFCVLGLSSTACMNMSTLQTARALEVGKYRAYVGGGFGGGSLGDKKDEDDETRPRSEISDLYWAEEVGFRGGVAENLEIGGKWLVPGGVGADAKYQFLDAGGFAVAVGLGASYWFLDTGDIDSSYSATSFAAYVPLYLSYDFNQYFSVYAAPQYVFSLGSSPDSNPDAGDARIKNQGHHMGYSFGGRLGNTFGLFSEVTVLAPLRDDGTFLVQYGSAFFLEF